jgi:hypothetical protein
MVVVDAEIGQSPGRELLLVGSNFGANLKV